VVGVYLRVRTVSRGSLDLGARWQREGRVVVGHFPVGPIVGSGTLKGNMEPRERRGHMARAGTVELVGDAKKEASQERASRTGARTDSRGRHRGSGDEEGRQEAARFELSTHLNTSQKCNLDNWFSIGTVQCLTKMSSK